MPWGVEDFGGLRIFSLLLSTCSEFAWSMSVLAGGSLNPKSSHVIQLGGSSRERRSMLGHDVIALLAREVRWRLVSDQPRCSEGCETTILIP